MKRTTDAHTESGAKRGASDDAATIPIQLILPGMWPITRFHEMDISGVQNVFGRAYAELPLSSVKDVPPVIVTACLTAELDRDRAVSVWLGCKEGECNHSSWRSLGMLSNACPSLPLPLPPLRGFCPHTAAAGLAPSNAPLIFGLQVETTESVVLRESAEVSTEKGLRQSDVKMLTNLVDCFVLETVADSAPALLAASWAQRRRIAGEVVAFLIARLTRRQHQADCQWGAHCRLGDSSHHEKYRHPHGLTLRVARALRDKHAHSDKILPCPNGGCCPLQGDATHKRLLTHPTTHFAANRRSERNDVVDLSNYIDPKWREEFGGAWTKSNESSSTGSSSADYPDRWWEGDQGWDGWRNNY